MADWFHGLHPVWQALIRVILFILPVFCSLPFVIWWERRFLSLMQDRIGPNRTGNIKLSRTSKWIPAPFRGKIVTLFGIPQIIADGIKSFFKEDFAPRNVDKFLFYLAPGVFLFPAFALGAVIPWGPFRSLTPVSDANIGVLYILAISSLGVYGVVLAGYSSDNKYSLLGGLRASAQLISYELGMSMALASVVIATGSLRPIDIVEAQQGRWLGAVPVIANWNVLTPYGFVAFVVFLLCMLAETNRAPFDLPECEQELVSGYNTEYSTKKWVLFMMGEYVNMITYSMVLVTVFFGGWRLLPVQADMMAKDYPNAAAFWELVAKLNGTSWIAPVWFFGKVALVMSAYIWIRGTLPRLRYDQLMNLGWKTLLPVATANLVLTALWLLTSAVASLVFGWLAFFGTAFLIWALARAIGGLNRRPSTIASRSVRLVSVAPVVAKEEAPDLAEATR